MSTPLTIAIERTRALLRSRGKPPLVVVTGPTASGKTGLSIELALVLAAEGQPCEVVNADSRQLYKKLDIGTAKVTPEEARGVPHHLIDVLDPKEPVTIGRYQERAAAAIADCHARGVLPLLVGGSMLYISAVIDGLQPLPTDPQLRAEIEAAYDRDGPEALHRELESLDPVSASTIHPNNRPYVVRALELSRLTGGPASAAKQTQPCPYELLLFILEWPTDVLAARIGKRTGQLLGGGWVAEVQRLREQGYTAADPGMQSHGYREILAALETGVSPDTLATDASLIERINANTRQYAKRQRTWWRDDPRAVRLDGQTG